MKAYVSVLKLRLINGLQYRAAALAGIATQFFFGFIFIMIFEAFYSNAAVEPPISLEQLVTYVWLQQSFLAFIVLWSRDSEIFQLITSGNIAYELCRPTGLYGFWYAKLVASRVSGALLKSFPILLIGFFLPEPYRIKLPPDPAAFLLFAVILLLGLLVLVAISMFIYISVFYTMSPTGSLLMFSVIGDFLSGLIIPIPLMPGWMQDIAYALPFHLTADFPFRVFSGHISKDAALLGIGKQVLWLAALVLLGYAALQRTLRRVVVQGG